MSDAHSPVLVRMETELKAALVSASKLHGRTLTGEINIRLRNSLTQQNAATSDKSHPDKPSTATAGKPHKYQAGHVPTVVHINNQAPEPTDPLSDLDRAMLDVYRSLPVEKQLALLSLFK